MNTIAQQIKAEAADASEAMELAEIRCALVSQDWAEESTTYTFEDGSKLELSGPIVKIVD